jgi:hypothetical protein
LVPCDFAILIISQLVESKELILKYEEDVIQIRGGKGGQGLVPCAVSAIAINLFLHGPNPLISVLTTPDYTTRRD